jgi:hypothetical protein
VICGSTALFVEEQLLAKIIARTGTINLFIASSFFVSNIFFAFVYPDKEKWNQ